MYTFSNDFFGSRINRIPNLPKAIHTSTIGHPISTPFTQNVFKKKKNIC